MTINWIKIQDAWFSFLWWSFIAAVAVFGAWMLYRLSQEVSPLLAVIITTPFILFFITDFIAKKARHQQLERYK